MSQSMYVGTNSYINTSVDDARSSLECRMKTDPLYVVLACSHSLVELQGRVGQTSRRQMLAGMIRKALKVVPMDETTTEKARQKGWCMSRGQDGGTVQCCHLMAFPPLGSKPVMMLRNALINVVITAKGRLGNKAAADFSRHELNRQLKGVLHRSYKVSVK